MKPLTKTTTATAYILRISWKSSSGVATRVFDTEAGANAALKSVLSTGVMKWMAEDPRVIPVPAESVDAYVIKMESEGRLAIAA